MRYEISINEEMLFALLRASLFELPYVQYSQVDWNVVLREAKSQTVVALAAKSIPNEVASLWQESALQDVIQSIRVLHEQTQLVRLLEQAGIPMVILKGTAAAQYYPDPFRRTLGDVDFLVPQSFLKRAKQVMEENEYIYDYGDFEGSRHLGYRKNGILFEMHWRFSSFDSDIDQIIQAGLDHTTIRQIEKHLFPSLPDSINGIVFLTHFRQHMLEAGIGLRHVIDWMMFVHSYLTPEKWKQEFRTLADEAGLTELAKTLTMMCKMYLGLPDDVPWCEDANSVVAEELMSFVLNSGNFGNKNQKSKKQWQVEAVSRNIQRKGLFSYLQHTGELRWKVLEKYPFLKPFAWIYQAERIVNEGLKCGLTINVIRDGLSSGVEKGRLLKKLGID